MLIVPALGLGSPAAVELGHCNRIYIDPVQWLRLDPGERRFILEHEQAHCMYGIESEEGADSFALQSLIDQGINPVNAYEAIVKTLDMDRPDHYSRAARIQQQINSMSASRQSLNANYSPAYGAPANVIDPGDGSAPITNSNRVDWTEVFSHGIDVGGEVVTDLLAGYMGNTPVGSEGIPPQQRQNRMPSWVYIAAAIGIGLLGWALFKK